MREVNIPAERRKQLRGYRPSAVSVFLQGGLKRCEKNTFGTRFHCKNVHFEVKNLENPFFLKVFWNGVRVEMEPRTGHLRFSEPRTGNLGQGRGV